MALLKICFLNLTFIEARLLKVYQFLKKNNSQIIRFLISGLIASSINYLVYNFLYLVSKNLFAASFCAYFVGVIVSFVFAKVWVFQNKSKNKFFQSFFIFCLIYILGGIEMSLVIFSVNKLVENHSIAWFFGAFIASLNNFLGSKYVSFKQ